MTVKGSFGEREAASNEVVDQEGYPQTGTVFLICFFLDKNTFFAVKCHKVQ